MTLLMDSYVVEIGDAVHDIVFGAGIIERLVPEQGKFWVRFNPNSLRFFDTLGFGSFKERTLYWRNPVMIIPHKNEKNWSLAVEIAQAVSKVLERN